MKKFTKLILICLILLALILGGFFLYPFLAERYQPEQPADTAREDRPAAVDFTVQDAAGEEVSLSDFFGQPIVLNFWASWCGPCLSELPAFAEAYAEHGDEICFLMVDLTDGQRETVEQVEGFLRENDYDLPVYFDTGLGGVLAYGVSSIPLTVFIDRDGNILAQQLGAMPAEKLQGYLDQLLAE